MIAEAIQAALSAIIPNTYTEIGDEGVSAPFCIHSESETEVRLKSGVIGYEVAVEVAIIDNTPDLVKTKSVSVIAALMALGETTNMGTIINSVNYEGDAPGFDQDSRLYANMLRFTIETSNH